MNLWRSLAVLSVGFGILECKGADAEGAFAFMPRAETELTYSTWMDPGLVSTQIPPLLFTTEIGATVPLGFGASPSGTSLERPGVSATWRSPRVATEASTALYESYNPQPAPYVRPISRSTTNTFHAAPPKATGNNPEGSTTSSGPSITNSVPGIRPPVR